jgi:hypothetical protein
MSNEKFKVKYGLIVGENTASIDTAGKITAKEIALTTYPTTKEITENDNLYYTNARARAAVSSVDAGGDGSFGYNSSTGVFTYTGPSAVEARAHFSVNNINSNRGPVGSISYNNTTGVITYTSPSTADLRSVVEVSQGSALKITDDGVFTTNGSILPNQVRIGPNAGLASPVGTDPSISIGYYAGQTKQAKNSIILNADSAPLNTQDTNTTGGFFVKPIRFVNAVDAAERVPFKLQYNPSTGEITHSNDTDYLDQGLRTVDYVKFASLTLGDYTNIAVPELAQTAYSFNKDQQGNKITGGKPVYYDGAKWCYFDGTAV